ncbi:Type 1 glutamine amidotransferase-like domain-containing protein, partial [Micrococcus sp. SIMBA_131]
MEPDNPLLDRYILKQAYSKQPKICFIPTASGDADGYIARFYAFFEKQLCVPSHLSLFKPHVKDIEAFLLSQDILYVGGGNTKNLLVLWKEWGLDQV